MYGNPIGLKYVISVHSPPGTLYRKYTPSFCKSGPSQFPDCVSCLKSKLIVPPQDASTGFVVADLGIAHPVPNHKCTPPLGLVPHGPPIVYPAETFAQRPLSVLPEKSSVCNPPSPIVSMSRVSPQAIVSLTEVKVTEH